MKTSLLTTTAAAMFALSFAAGGANAASKWDGADDLPTSPLACDAGGAAAPAAAKPYDGGQPTSAPDKSGKEITDCRRAEADRHRLFQRDHQRHAGRG